MAFQPRFLKHKGITVIQKLDPSVQRLRPGKVGMVLAGGAVSGGAFKAGGLRALDEVLVKRRLPGGSAHAFGLNEFDVFVGLSAGSVLASVLAAGINPDEVFRILRGTSDVYEAFRPWHFMRPNAFEIFERLRLFARKEEELFTNWLSGATDSRSGGRYTLRATLAKMAEAMPRLLPTGLFDPRALEKYLARQIARTGIPDDFTAAFRRTGKELYLTATDLNRGELVVFGHDEPYSKVRISTAIAASCAIPLWYRPMLVDNPRAGEPGEPDRLDLAKEVVFLDPNVQADVVFIEPAEDDYTFFGMGALNFWTKDRAAAHGYHAVREAIEASHELLSELFRGHGIELRMPPRAGTPIEADRLQVDLRESRGRALKIPNR